MNKPTNYNKNKIEFIKEFEWEEAPKKIISLEKQISKLTTKELKIYLSLDNMINKLADNNVDVSYFPVEARFTLIKFSKTIAKIK